MQFRAEEQVGFQASSDDADDQFGSNGLQMLMVLKHGLYSIPDTVYIPLYCWSGGNYY